MELNNINTKLNFINISSSTPQRANNVAFISQRESSTNEQKVDVKKAGVNFLKGFVSPITSMFSSPKNFLIGTGIIVANMGLMVATCGTIAPVLVVAGLATGAVQGAKTIYDFKNAKNNTDLNKAFYEAGEAASTIGMSVLGAKPSLKQAGIITDGMNAFDSTAKCFTSMKSSLNSSYSSLKQGLWRSCLRNLVEPLKRNKQLMVYAKQLHDEGNLKINDAIAEVKNILPEDLKCNVTGRAKGVKSIYNKFERKAKKGATFDNFNSAKQEIKDLAGIRIELENPSPEQLELLSKSLIKAAKDKKIQILEVENYYGKPESGYFSEDQCLKIGLASNIDSYSGSKKSGYITTQLNLVHENGMLSELQIRGKEINKLAEVEHIMYNLREGKHLSNGVFKLTEHFAPIRSALSKTDKSQYKNYLQYISENFDYARKLEEGKVSTKPVLPEGINKMLEIENVEKLHHQANLIQKNDSPIKYASPVTASSIYSGINSLTARHDKYIYNKISKNEKEVMT